jgi:two-component system, response regulator PdtaR
MALRLPYWAAMSIQKAADSNTRWRVAIVDDHERSRSALRSAIWAAGGEIVGESLRCSDSLPMIRRASPDVVVCAAGLPDGDGVQAAAQVTQADYPVVLFTSHTDEALVERARAAGVMGFLLKPLRPAELAPALDLAIARFKETRQLKQSLEGRKVIERAKGTLMARFGLTEEEAFRRLRRAAMDSRRPMLDIARALLVSETVAKP